MQEGSTGLLIIVFGLLVIYLAITGRYRCFTDFIACIGGAGDAPSDDKKPKVVTPLDPLRPIFPQ